MIHEVMGGIRRVGFKEWEPIIDATHQPVGIASIEHVGDHLASTAYLIVHFDFTAEYVIHGGVTGDEKYAISNILPGDSVGLDHALIVFGKAGVQINPERITNPDANCWLNMRLGSADV